MTYSPTRIIAYFWYSISIPVLDSRIDSSSRTIKNWFTGFLGLERVSKLFRVEFSAFNGSGQRNYSLENRALNVPRIVGKLKLGKLVYLDSKFWSSIVLQCQKKLREGDCWNLLASRLGRSTPRLQFRVFDFTGWRRHRRNSVGKTTVTEWAKIPTRNANVWLAASDCQIAAQFRNSQDLY